MTSRRRGAFDPARFDEELVELLAATPAAPGVLDRPSLPAHSGPVVEPADLADDPGPRGEDSRPTAGPAMVDEDVEAPAAPADPVTTARRPAPGAGTSPDAVDARSGRLSASADDPGAAAERSGGLGGLRQVAVRIPRLLYEAVAREVLSGVERPSYGQLVAWTAQDHPGEVQGALAGVLAQPARRPRGRRLAAQTAQLTLRVTPGELAEIDRLLEQAGGAEQGVTRTKVVTAVLQVAVERGR